MLFHQLVGLLLDVGNLFGGELSDLAVFHRTVRFLNIDDLCVLLCYREEPMILRNLGHLPHFEGSELDIREDTVLFICRNQERLAVCKNELLVGGVMNLHLPNI